MESDKPSLILLRHFNFLLHKLGVFIIKNKFPHINIIMPTYIITPCHQIIMTNYFTTRMLL